MAKIIHDKGTESSHRRHRSRFHSTLLLLAMTALLAYCGWIVADWQEILWSLLASAAMLVMLQRMPPGVFLQALNARVLGRWKAPTLYQILEDLCRIAGVEPSPLLCRVFGPAPVAFTIGGGNAAMTSYRSH